MRVKQFYVGLLTVTAALTCSVAPAHDARAETTALLQKQKLPDVPGKQVIMAVVSYAPGQASTPHRHNGSVFAYVIEGEVVSQLQGQPPMTYKTGQSWYEPPLIPHLISRNASAEKPAKLLAWLLLDEGGQVKEPLP
jgi:quercetin dioxygenase-like cupin family protein